MADIFNVLVIEDDSDLRETLKNCLVKLGCDVATAETAETGIEKIKGDHFDAVFASLCLRGQGGRGIARWVKANDKNQTKFFITTSWKGDLEREMLRFDGINDIIRKPFSFCEIRDKVLEHLG